MKASVFNPVDYLETEAEINEYLHEAFIDDDPQVFVIALGHLVKHHGYAKIADITGLNRESLYKPFKGESQPTWDTMHKIMKGLKLDVSFTAVI